MALVAGRKPKATNNCLTVLSAMTKWWHAEHDLPPPRYRVGPVKQPKDRRAAFYEHEPFARLVALPRVAPSRTPSRRDSPARAHHQARRDGRFWAHSGHTGGVQTNSAP